MGLNGTAADGKKTKMDKSFIMVFCTMVNIVRIDGSAMNRTMVRHHIVIYKSDECTSL